MLARWKQDPLIEIIQSVGKKGALLFTLVFFCNLLAALLEGISYSLILLALTHLCGEGSVPFFSFFPGAQNFLSSFSSNQLFMLFLILAITLQIFRAGMTYVAQIGITLLAVAIQTEGQKRIYSQLFRLTFRCISNYKVGDLVEYTKVPTALTSPVMDALNKVLVSLLMILASFTVMFLLSPALTIFNLLLFGILAFSQRFIIKKNRKKFAKASKYCCGSQQKNCAKHLWHQSYFYLQ